MQKHVFVVSGILSHALTFRIAQFDFEDLEQRYLATKNGGRKKKVFDQISDTRLYLFFPLYLSSFFLTLYLNSIRTGHLVVFEEISDPVIFCRLRIPLDKLLPRHPPSSSCAQQQVECAGDRKHHRHPLPGYTNFIVCLYLRPMLYRITVPCRRWSVSKEELQGCEEGGEDIILQFHPRILREGFCVCTAIALVCDEKPEKIYPQGRRNTKIDCLNQSFFFSTQHQVSDIDITHPVFYRRMDELCVPGSFYFWFSLFLEGVRTLIFLSLVDRMSINRLVTNFSNE